MKQYCLWPNNIPESGGNTVYFPVHLATGIWVVSVWKQSHENHEATNDHMYVFDWTFVLILRGWDIPTCGISGCVEAAYMQR